MLLNQEEYIEQVFFFRSFLERLENGYSTQEILYAMKSELLSTVKLPLAVDYLLTEVKLSGSMNRAMKRMLHYFTPFQTFVVEEAEREGGRFDFKTGLRVLEREAKYRSDSPSIQGLFFYQFETISRNRLGFDDGLSAIAADPIYNDDWRNWINVPLRNQLGIIDFADLVYVRSEYYKKKPDEESIPVLFGEREGRIAFASRRRDPTFLFAALARHLGYPEVPRTQKIREEENLIPVLLRRLELLESSVQLMKEELGGGINLERFYKKND